MRLEPKTFFLDIPVSGGKETNKTALYEWGNRSNSKGTVFCVHGLTRNGRDFDILASALSEDYRVISIDMAGRGKSEWHINPTYYNYAAYAADIQSVASQLGFKKIHWIGTSMGGIIGMIIAGISPNLLASLTLNDIGCFIPAAGLKRIAEYAAKTNIFSSAELAQAELRRRCAPYGIKREEDWQHLFTHSIEKTSNNNVRLTYDPDIIKNLGDNEITDINLWNMWEAIKAIPTLLIRGSESDLLTHETAIEMQSNHPNFMLLEVAGAGHAPALIDSEQIEAIKKRMGNTL